MSDLIVERNIKVKNNKTNISIPISRYIIKTFRWDLRSSNVIIDVDYYMEQKYLFTNEFVFEGKEDVYVDKLIKQVKELH